MSLARSEDAKNCFGRLITGCATLNRQNVCRSDCGRRYATSGFKARIGIMRREIEGRRTARLSDGISSCAEHGNVMEYFKVNGKTGEIV